MTNEYSIIRSLVDTLLLTADQLDDLHSGNDYQKNRIYELEQQNKSLNEKNTELIEQNKLLIRDMSQMENKAIEGMVGHATVTQDRAEGIKRKPIDTRKIEVNNHLLADIRARSVVTAEGNIYMEIYEVTREIGSIVTKELFQVIPIEEVDF